MAPLLQRSTVIPQNRLQTRSQPQDSLNSTTANTLSLADILAIAFGIFLAIFFAIVIYSVVCKRQEQSSSPTSKPIAQINFFEKLAADQRAIESGTFHPSTNLETVWNRDSFLYAAQTGREAPRMVLENPGAVWAIKPIAPAVTGWC